MPDFTCPECRRPYGDPEGCDWSYTDFRPMVYAAEQNPLSSGPTCRDCATPKGATHMPVAHAPSARAVTTSGTAWRRAARTTAY